METTEMIVSDVNNLPELEIKLKDTKSRELGR